MVELDQGGRLAGRAGVVPVGAELSSLAEHSFVLLTEGESTPSWRIVPDLAGHLVVHFTLSPEGRHRVRSTTVVGARTVYTDAPMGRRSFSVGVRLRPGALAGLTGTGADQFTDRSIPLTELLPRDAERLREQLEADPRPEPARGAVLGFLRRIAPETPAPDWRVRGALLEMARTGADRVHRLAAALGVGRRTLRRVFRSEIGFSPRHALRVERVHRAMTEMVAHPTALHSRVAARAGFTDQAHMIREFRGLLGETPGRWAARRFS